MTTPMKIHVDPASGCNFRCFFCPQSDPQALRAAGIEFRSMPLPLFCKLIDDLAAFPARIDELVLGNYGEPLLNKRLPEMVRYAKRSARVREISVVTNASLLTKNRADALVSAGLDKIRISVEALSDEGYAETAGVAQRFSGIVESVNALREAVRRRKAKTFIYVKIVDTGLSEAECRFFFHTFAPIADAVSIENLMADTPQAAKIVGDQSKGMTGVGLASERNVCPSPFYSLSVHSNGDVGVCCSDWHHKTVVGSIARESLAGIWAGEALREFRLAQLTKSWRGLDACAGCEMVKHYPVYEDLDRETAELVAAFER
jgi:MoaA/NifB/PqqE/SkfB family radical SAM enzyme